MKHVHYMLLLILANPISHAQISHHMNLIISFASFTDGRGKEGEKVIQISSEGAHYPLHASCLWF